MGWKMCLLDPTVEGNRAITALSFQYVFRLVRPREADHRHMADARNTARIRRGAFHHKTDRCGARAHNVGSLSALLVDPLWLVP